MQRRQFIKSAASLAATRLVLPWPLRQRDAEPDMPFDYAWLKGHARALATRAWQPPPSALPAALADLDYDAFQAIRFRPDHALWAEERRLFQVRLFHRGRGFREKVRIYQVERGRAREVLYDPAQFDFRGSGITPRSLPRDLGFAGFRVQFHTAWDNDVAAFLGASYFRAVGGERQYGLSARGLAVDTGMDRPEEFPVFTAFWLKCPETGSDRLTVYALLDSPSIAGAYRFDITPGATLTMDIDAALYPRKPIARLGLAPFSTMFLCGKNDRRMANDWRPEIHDSDGLALWTGKDERIWRPLANPRVVRVNSYFDSDPQGFGLLQRDRNFDHYQDDGAFYDRRPSVWVEPRKVADRGWGKGAIQLLEIPTADETFDNVAVWWTPGDKPLPGQELLYSYRLYWGTRMPFAPPLAQAVATRTGIGGVVGQKRRYFSWRFAVDFAGGTLAALDAKAHVQAVIWASRGTIEITSARPLLEIGGYRAMFDLRPPDDGTEPIDLRLYLRLDGQALSETWLSQWTPPPAAERTV